MAVLLEFEILDVPDVPIRFIDLPTTGVAVEAEMVAVVAMMDIDQGWVGWGYSIE